MNDGARQMALFVLGLFVLFIAGVYILGLPR